MPEAASAIDELVAANHILFDQGVVDGFGHVSVRHPTESDRFLLARSIAPALVTAADIMEFDLDGNPLDARGRALYLERFIHSEIYRARPDAGAVVHSHSPAVVPFSVAKRRAAARRLAPRRNSRRGLSGVRNPCGRRAGHRSADSRPRSGSGPGEIARR